MEQILTSCSSASREEVKEKVCHLVRTPRGERKQWGAECRGRGSFKGRPPGAVQELGVIKGRGRCSRQRERQVQRLWGRIMLDVLQKHRHMCSLLSGEGEAEEVRVQLLL